MDFKEFIKEDTFPVDPSAPKSPDDDLKKRIKDALKDAKKTGKAIKRMRRARSRKRPGSGLIGPLKRLFGL